MSSAQDRWVLAATAVAESAWLYAAFGVFGLGMGAGEGDSAVVGAASPLGWPGVLAVLAGGILVSRLLQSVGFTVRLGTVLQLVVGAGLIYVAVAGRVDVAGGGLDMGWLSRLFGSGQSETYRLRAVLGSLLGVGVWWRGGGLAASESPGRTLMSTFKVGAVAIGVATIVDAASPADLGVYPVMVVFIVSALAGLATGRLLPGSSRRARLGAWPRVIGAVVAAIAAAGLLLGLLHDRLLSAISDGAGSAVGFLAEEVVQPASAAIAWPFFWVTSWIFSHFQGQEPQQQDPGFTRFSEVQDTIKEEVAEKGTPVFVEYVGWVMLALVILVVLYVVARAFWKRAVRRLDPPVGVRESVAVDADPARDIAKLLLGLLPGRLRRGHGARGYRLPDAEPRVVEALKLYYRLLTLAEAKGVARSVWETPVEFQAKLEEVLPPGLVRMATSAFVRACYGGHPAPEAHLGEMRALVDRLAAAGT